MASSRLSPFQSEVLNALFERESGFFLTGGAALAGFHLGHRVTDDLDLFTAEPESFERSRHLLPALASELGARVEIRQDAPDFRRYALVRKDDTLIVDTVLDRTAQAIPQKMRFGAIIVDPPEEILANKLTTLVSRSEERDLVDLLFLERNGLRVEQALAAALAKDGGCTPATLAWLLSQVSIPDDIKLPAGVSPQELRAFVGDLVVRLRAAAHPSSKLP